MLDSVTPWRPVLALVSLTGVWGLSYLIMAVPAALAALVNGWDDRRAILRTTAWLVVLGTAVGGYGAWYDRAPGDSAGQSVSVGLVTVRQPYDPVDITSARGRQLVAFYQATVSRLASSGATVVVAPEKVFSVPRAAQDDPVRPMRRLASSSGVELVIGVVLDDSASGDR